MCSSHERVNHYIRCQQLKESCQSKPRVVKSQESASGLAKQTSIQFQSTQTPPAGDCKQENKGPNTQELRRFYNPSGVSKPHEHKRWKVDCLVEGNCDSRVRGVKYANRINVQDV